MNTGRNPAYANMWESVKRKKKYKLLIINLKTFQDEKEFVYEYACNGRYAVCDLVFARRIA